MFKIDSHNHFWRYNPIRDSWIDEEKSILKRDFLPKDLIFEINDTYQNGCVVVQSDSSEAENRFQLEMASETDFIKGIIGWVDFESSDIKDKLDYYHQFSLIKGFRHILQSEKQRDFMLRKDFLNGISLLGEKEFTYDILIFEDQMSFASTFIQKFPYQKFILDHIGKPDIRNQNLKSWSESLKRIAQNPNLWCKLSGMITEANWATWHYKDIEPFMETVLHAFGPNRILWGSDWPVCLLAGTYKQTYELVTTFIQKLSSNEQQNIMGGNAIEFYSLI